jgi:hypothetical protein
MRTTLTIDDDVAGQIDRVRRDGDISLKRLVNQALRLGLQEIGGSPKPRKPFKTRTVNLGKPLIDNLDCVPEILEKIEGEWFR